MKTIKEQVTERLIRYAKINTASDSYADSFPSSARQRDLAVMLYNELKEFGTDEVHYDEKKCIVYARIKSNLKNNKTKAVGLIAHLDTSPEAPSENIKPWLLENYDGGAILLNAEENITMTPVEFPVLKNYVGKDLILTDGTTLLGADDKAAISSIMTFAEFAIKNPDFTHGDICLAFTPDEEVGGLARDLDFERFGADIAYTVDCDHLGHYSKETFYASEVEITVKGLGVHPGTAKGIMKNAAEITAEFISSLPEKEKPQFTEGREGFFYVINSSATCERGTIELIIRDFDLEKFKAKEKLIAKISERLNQKHGQGTVSFQINEQYKNMAEVIDNYPFLTEKLKKAITLAGVEAVEEPFRGGTDGAALSFRGLPCPNLSAGYENAHGKYEFACVQSMEKNVEILKNLIKIYSK